MGRSVIPAIGARNARLWIEWVPMLKPEAGSRKKCPFFTQLEELREQ
jgi:hypothetical protein